MAMGIVCYPTKIYHSVARLVEFFKKEGHLNRIRGRSCGGLADRGRDYNRNKNGFYELFSH